MIQTDCNFKIKKSILTEKEINKVVVLASHQEKKIKGVVEINVISDKEMTRLNYQFRGKKYPTDVLSFAWQEDQFIPTQYLGQIYICQNQIIRQAKEWEVTPRQEFARMLVHGLLHLVGYDHMEPQEAKKMFSLQENILKKAHYVR
jgi:probable rRNA maturation factor